MAGRAAARPVDGPAVRVERASFLEALGMVAGVVPARSAKPVLQDVEIETGPEGLTLAGTDLEVGIRIRVADVEVRTGGRVRVAAARLLGVIRELTAEGLDLVREGEHLLVRSTGSSFRLLVNETDDIPSIPGFEEKAILTLQAGEIRAMARRTVFAAAKEPTRYALNGVFIRLGGGKVEFVATDGKRLSWVVRAAEAATGDPRTAIVTTKGLQVLDRVLGDDAEGVEVQIGDSDIRFRTARAVVVSRLVDGQYPNYEEVIPKETVLRAILPVTVLATALRQIKTVTTQEQPAVRLKFGNDRLQMSADVRDVGTGEVGLDIHYDGAPVELAFNPEYVLDVLKVVETDTLELGMTDSTSPGLFTEDKEAVFVLMPMNVV